MKALGIHSTKTLICVCFLTFSCFTGNFRAIAGTGNEPTDGLKQGAALNGTGTMAPLASDIDNQGTIIIKGDLVNLNPSPLDLGPGTIEFSGTSAQSVSGQNVFGNLTLNNANGLTITDDQEVTGVLTLTSGHLNLGTLGDKNLLMGASASVAGTPSASAMVVATGNGELRKEFAAPGSFTYPVGDNTGTAEYSPVTLSFTGGTFNSGNYAGVNLVNAKYPDDSITGSYLNRYWNISQSGISGFNCNAVFKYNSPSDVTGTESSLYCVRVNTWTNFDPANTGLHQLTANGLTGFSTFTGTMGQMAVSLTAFLQGPYDPNTNLMNTNLNDNGWIPTNQQPYNGSPWFYTPSQAVVSIPAGVVDWVLVELREGTTPDMATTITRKAAFLKNDGSIVNTDGTSPLRFNNVALTTGNDLYPVVRHRNHMAILANYSAGVNPDGSFVYNFAADSDDIFGGISGYVQIDSSPVRWGMPGADANGDGFVFGNDYTDYWVPLSGNEEIYDAADFNLDGFIFGNDYTELWIPNSGMENPLP